MKNRIIEILSSLDDRVESKWGFRIDPHVEIKKMGKIIAGTANYHQSLICLNSRFLDEYPDYVLSQTLVHEYCHLLVIALVGLNGIKRKQYSSHHGKEWQAAMRFFELEPNRCHPMILKR